MTIPASLLSDLLALPSIADAATARHLVTVTLRARGFRVRAEMPTPYASRAGVRHHGRIDLFATRDDLRLVIEIDRRTPRRKSIEKLRVWRDCDRLIVLREGMKRTCTAPEGIDAMVCIGTRGEREDVPF